MTERQTVFCYSDTHTEVKVVLRHLTGDESVKDIDQRLADALDHAGYRLQQGIADRPLKHIQRRDYGRT